MEFEVKIIDYDHQGRGIGHINNKIIFIPNTIINEVVKVTITKNKKNYMEGIVKEYINKSNKRRENLCPYYPKCGGCDILHIPYKEQLAYKQKKIKNIMQKYVKENFIINDIVSSDNDFNYRNKVTLHSDKKNIGYYNKNTNKLIPINKCLLLDNKLNEYLNRNIKSSGTLILRTNGNTVLDNKKDSLFKNIGSFKFKVSLESFFQINDNVTYKLYEKIKEYIKENDKEAILDLYCGTGTIGIYLSNIANNVLGIEINKNAIKDAEDNKKLNNISNISFIADDVEKVIHKIKFKPTTIIVDPPRSGLSKKTIQQIIKFNPKKIIYVSCDPMTLARDLNILKSYFIIKELTPFDMFPNTHHVECVSVLYRKTFEK